MSKKALYGCVLCRDCKFKRDPKPLSPLTTRDMIRLHCCSCAIDGKTYGVVADRKCLNYSLIT